MISTRPLEVETRQTAGHWEGDLINGAHDTGNLVTLVERKMRYTLIVRTDSKEAKELKLTEFSESHYAETRIEYQEKRQPGRY